jgi:hypothetical protein
MPELGELPSSHSPWSVLGAVTQMTSSAIKALSSTQQASAIETVTKFVSVLKLLLSQTPDFLPFVHQLLVLLTMSIRDREVAEEALDHVPTILSAAFRQVMENSPSNLPMPVRFDLPIVELFPVLLAKSAATQIPPSEFSAYEHKYAWLIRPNRGISSVAFDFPRDLRQKIRDMIPVMEMIYST